MREELARRKERIYLTGFMGSGKSTIGPILANSLGYEYADLDRLIESTEGRTVREIFLEKGETHFRSVERALLLQLSTKPNAVISLGGGTLVDSRNLESVFSTGIVIYLKVAPEVLLRRVERKQDRPLLAGPDGAPLKPEEVRHRVGRLYQLREPLYELADITIVAQQHVGLTVEQIVRRLRPLFR